MSETRYRFIQIRPGIRAVVDSATGAYYGLTEYEGSVWGARDWAGLSLPVGYSENPERARLQVEARKNHEWWADKLIERADRRGGLPVAEDPQARAGLVDGYLFLPGGRTVAEVGPDCWSFNVYTELGRYLGVVMSTPDDDWIPYDKFGATSSLTSTRTEAAYRLDWENGQQAAVEAKALDEEAIKWIEENKDEEG